MKWASVWTVSLDLSWSEIHCRIITQICVCGCLHLMCRYCHCDSLQKGLPVCLRVCLVILMCYISLSAVVYERFRRAKQYLKQHYRNIIRDSHLSLQQRIVWNKADLPPVQPALILSVSHTANQDSTWRQITNDGLVCFWLHLLLSCVFGFLDSCVHHLVSLLVQFCKHTHAYICLSFMCF